MKTISILFLTLVVFFNSSNCSAQLPTPDTLNIKIEKPHSPTKATLFSTALPGLGQVYNKKYWKVPIVYAGIGTSLYFAFSNNKSFKKFKTAYGERVDGDENTVDEFVGRLSDDGIKANMEFHQRNRDLSYIVAGLFYVLNIVDAAVDAHLFDFPKNDNLSFNLQPSIELTNNNQVSSGFKLVINL